MAAAAGPRSDPSQRILAGSFVLTEYPQFSYSTLSALLGGIGVNSTVRPGACRMLRKGWLGASYSPKYSMPVSTTFFALSGNGFLADRRMTLVSLSGIIFKQREGYFWING